MSDKRSTLIKVLGSKELADEILGKTQSTKDVLDAMGIASKDIDTSDEVTEVTPSEAVAEEAVESETNKEVTIEATSVDETISTEEVNEEDAVIDEPVSALVEAITENVTKSLHMEDLNALLKEIIVSQKEITERMDRIEVADEEKINKGIAEEMNQPIWKGFKASGDDSTLVDNVLDTAGKHPEGPKLTDTPDIKVNTLMKFMEGVGLGLFEDGGNQ